MRTWHLPIIGLLLAVLPATSNAAKPEPGSGQLEKADPAEQLDRLFEGLRVAPDAVVAKAIESRIDARLIAKGSQTSRVLLERAGKAAAADRLDIADALLESVVALDPAFSEGRYQRATIAFQRKNTGVALAELEAALALEPRHYGAWAGLGVVFQSMGEDRKALEAFRRAKALHPFYDKLDEAISSLTGKVDGRDI